MAVSFLITHLLFYFAFHESEDLTSLRNCLPAMIALWPSLQEIRFHTVDYKRKQTGENLHSFQLAYAVLIKWNSEKKNILVSVMKLEMVKQIEIE